MSDIVSRIEPIMRRDDACDLIVPSDLRELVGEIKRQRALLRTLQEPSGEVLDAMILAYDDTIDILSSRRNAMRAALSVMQGQGVQ